MKKFLLLFSAIMVAIVSTAATTEASESEKVRIKFGGCLDVRLQYNDYNSYLSRDMINLYPYAPNINEVGVDLNDVNDFGFSVFSSRLSFNMDRFQVLGAEGRVYFEGDFLGISDTYLQMFRMRHAYFSLQWKKDKLLMGQTGTLLSNFSDLMANTVDFGAGVPFAALNRGVQVQYEHDFTPKVKLRVASEMYGWHKGVGPAEAQANSCIPDFQGQMTFGDRSGKNPIGGFTVGAKVLQPRTVTESGYKTTKKVASYVGSGFAKFFIGDYKVQMMATFGSNMSPYTLWGGYGMVQGEDKMGDYNYTNFLSSSEWIDIDSPLYGMWQWGLFVGHQHNYGSLKPIDLETGYYKDQNLQWFMRIAPRVWFHPAKKFAFGLEYSRNIAQWGEKINDYGVAYKSFPLSNNNRVVLLAKYIF